MRDPAPAQPSMDHGSNPARRSPRIRARIESNPHGESEADGRHVLDKDGVAGFGISYRVTRMPVSTPTSTRRNAPRVLANLMRAAALYVDRTVARTVAVRSGAKPCCYRHQILADGQPPAARACAGATDAAPAQDNDALDWAERGGCPQSPAQGREITGASDFSVRWWSGVMSQAVR